MAEKWRSPLPGHEVGRGDVEDAKGNEAEDDDGEAIHED